MVTRVWLAYCTECKTYRTHEQASAPKEWTIDINEARVFRSEGHALNSARYYRSHMVDGVWTDHKQFGVALRYTLVPKEGT